MSPTSNSRTEFSHMRSGEKGHPLYFSSAFVLLFDMGTFLLVPDLGVWVSPVTCSLSPEEAHFNVCSSSNSQASQFYPVTPTHSNTPCLSLAKHLEAAASSFHKRVDPRFPILSALEVHQTGCKEVSLLDSTAEATLHSLMGSPELLQTSPRTKCKCCSMNHQQVQGTFRGRTLTANTKFPQQLLKEGCSLQIPVSCI